MGLDTKTSDRLTVSRNVTLDFEFLGECGGIQLAVRCEVYVKTSRMEYWRVRL
jgi:hypothetical protein